jgi:hypothetical protein
MMVRIMEELAERWKVAELACPTADSSSMKGFVVDACVTRTSEGYLLYPLCLPHC